MLSRSSALRTITVLVIAALLLNTLAPVASAQDGGGNVYLPAVSGGQSGAVEDPVPPGRLQYYRTSVEVNTPAQWQSLARIEAWHPETIVLTHFGPVNRVPTHLAELRDHLHLVERLADTALAVPGDDAAREQWFIEEVRTYLARSMSDADVRVYEAAGRLDLNWRGLVRHARTRNR